MSRSQWPAAPMDSRPRRRWRPTRGTAWCGSPAPLQGRDGGCPPRRTGGNCHPAMRSDVSRSRTASAHSPRNRHPPQQARDPASGPQASTERSDPKTASAAEGRRYAAAIEQPTAWQTHQATLASTAARASITSTNDTGSSSPPPSQVGSSKRNIPTSCRASSRGATRRPSASDAAPHADRLADSEPIQAIARSRSGRPPSPGGRSIPAGSIPAGSIPAGSTLLEAGSVGPPRGACHAGAA